MKNSTTCLGLLILCSALSIVRGASGGADPLEIRLRDIPLDFRAVPLSQALDRIAYLANSDFVLFGTEIQTVDGREPVISVHIDSGKTMQEVLLILTAQIPDYEFEGVGSHLINVLPVSALNDPKDLLNVRAGSLHLHEVVLTNFLSNPARYVPELKAAILQGATPGCAMGIWSADSGVGINADLRAGTIRDQLNEASVFSASMAERGQAKAYGWVYFHELFPSGTRPEYTWRVLTSWNPASQHARGIATVKGNHN